MWRLAALKKNTILFDRIKTVLMTLDTENIHRYSRNVSNGTLGFKFNGVVTREMHKMECICHVGTYTTFVLCMCFSANQ